MAAAARAVLAGLLLLLLLLGPLSEGARATTVEPEELNCARFDNRSCRRICRNCWDCLDDEEYPCRGTCSACYKCRECKLPPQDRPGSAFFK